MTDKITIERETVEQLLEWIDQFPIPTSGATAWIFRLTEALAAQPATVDDHLKCGHHRSLAINSAETGEFLYCDLCDAKSRCRDAETMEEELRAALAAQPAEPVADDPAIRWNFDASDTHLLVCREDHDKGDKCEYEQLHPAEVLAIVNRLRSRAIELACRNATPAAVPLTDKQIASIVREASKGAAIRRDGTTSTRIARAVERAHGIAAAAGDKP